MSEYAVTQRFLVRSNMGRFLSRYERAKARAIDRTAREGAQAARMLAPKRSGRLAASIRSSTGTSGGAWTATAPYSMAQELGARRHPITGWVNFFWEKEGRRWVPGPNQIDHPGNPGVHFMSRSYAIVAPRLVDRLREEMR